MLVTGSNLLQVFSTRDNLYNYNRVHETASRAMEILKERFARGEIDKAEFEEKSAG
jgi:uncharacterized membrane protein